MRKKLLIAAVLLISTSSLAQSPAPAPKGGAVPLAGAANTAQASAKLDPAEEADIRRLLELTGAKNMGTDAMNSMMISIRPLMLKSLPPGEYREKLVELFFEKFQEKADLGPVLDLAVQSYSRYYTAAEIHDLVKFYESPLGKKMSEVTPKIVSEMRDQSQQWGRRLGQDCMAEVLTEHPDLQQALEDAAKPKPQ